MYERPRINNQTLRRERLQRADHSRNTLEHRLRIRPLKVALGSDVVGGLEVRNEIKDRQHLEKYRMSPKPYHNPENVDESRVPDGWRFLYEDEAGKKKCTQSKVWISYSFPPLMLGSSDKFKHYSELLTYIVPVNDSSAK